MKAWLGAVVVGLGLGLASAEAWAWARDGVGAPPPPPAPVAGVEVLVADSISDADTIRGWVEERAAIVLDRLERRLERGEVIRIDVRGRAFAYAITVVLVRNGQVLDGEQQPPPFACECGSQELLERIGEAVEAGAKVLGEVAEREREEAEAEAERQRQEELRRQEAERAAAEQRRARYQPSRLGRAGIGVLGVGGVVTLSGIIMAVQSPQEVSMRQVSHRDWAPPGYAVIGIGATAMATGIAVLIVDVVRCRKHRERCGTPTAAWAIDGARWAATSKGGAR